MVRTVSSRSSSSGASSSGSGPSASRRRSNDARRCAEPRLSSRITNWRSAAVRRPRAFARIMSKPPAVDDLVMLRRVIAFGQELAGTLRRASVVDALLRHVRENLAPTEIALSLFHHDVDAQDSLHVWPPRGPARQQLLEHVSRRGAQGLPDGLGPLLADGTLP